MASDGEEFEFARNPETQFMPEDDDEDVLWEVIEIIEEKNRKYKVLWAGVDPDTNKPWAPSWVSRKDCTDDLVQAWKKKQALKKKKGKGAKGGRGASVASKRSNASASTISRAGNTASTSRKRASTSAKVGQKRTRSSTISRTPDTGSVYASDQDVEISRPRKRPKYSADPDSDEEDNDLPPVAVLEKSKQRGRKKLVEPSSSSSSSNYSDGDLPSDVSRSPSPVPVPVRESNGKGKRRIRTSDEEDELEETDARPVKGRKPTKNARITNKAPSKALTKQANQRRKRSPSSSPPPPPAPKPAPPRRIITTKESQLPQPAPKPALPRRITTAKEALAPQPAAKPALPRRIIINKESSLPQLPSQEPLRNRPVDRNKLQRNDTFPPKERLPSLSPSSHAQLRLWEEDMKFLDEQKASTSKVGPSRTASKENVRDPSPSPSPPAAASNTTSKRANPTRNGLEDSYRREIVPETDLESSNNTQSQSQETQETQPSNPVKPLENDEESRQPNPPQTPNTAAAKRPFRRENSLIGKMKTRTPGSVNKTQSRWALYDDEHENNYQLPSPSLPLYTHNEEPLDLPVVEPSLVEEPPLKDQEHGSDDKDDVEVKDEDEEPVVVVMNPIPKPQFQPIPQISPSKFTPYLPTSSISMDNPQDEEAEVQGLISSIEQFSSDEEGGSRRRRLTKKDKGKGRAIDADDDDPFNPSQKSNSHFDQGDRASELHDRGIELAEQARQERRRNSDPKERNGPLIDLGKIGKKSPGQDSSKGGDQSKTFSAAVQRSPSPMASPEMDFSITQEDVVESGSVEQLPSLALRQEEEESTQDLLAEHEAQLPPPEPSSQPMDDVVDQGEESDMVLESDREDVGTASGRIRLPTPSLEPVKEENEEKMEDENAVKSHDAKEDLEEQRLSPPAPPKHPQKAESPEVPSSSPIPPQENKSRSGSAIDRPSPREQSPIIVDNTQDNATASIEASSSESLMKEVARLEALLTAERAKTTALQDEVDGLKDASMNASVSTPPPDAAELRSLRAQLQQQKEGWEAQTLAFTTSIEQLTKGKASAERDVEFFREQYARASGFVTSVREENQELEQKAKIASDQAKIGVEMVKAAFEHRIKSLEDDVKTWKKLGLFALEKESLTNDDIRRRAAEHPELLMRIDQLEDQIAEFEDSQAALEASMGKVIDEGQLQIRELENENEAWRKEVMSLKAEVNDYRSRLEETSKLSQEVNTSNEMVYRCLWRPEGTNHSCDGVFLSVEDLHAHMFSDGHLSHS